MGIPNVVFRPATGAQVDAVRVSTHVQRDGGVDDEDMGEGGGEADAEEFASDQLSGDGTPFGGIEGTAFGDGGLRQGTAGMEEDSDANDSPEDDDDDDDDGLTGYL